jgi:DNA-binding SARP family transcriptional activator
MAVLVLRLLGDFLAHDADGREVEVSARKGRALLAFLALQPSMASPRNRLASLLWSDRNDAQARNSLRQTLSVLRKDLGNSTLDGDDERVALRDTTTDIVEFLHLAAEQTPSALQKAAKLYQGDFLADMGTVAPAFDEWLQDERQRIVDLLIRTLERLLPALPGEERIAAAKRLVALDPLREASHLALMRAHEEAGDRARALAAYGAAHEVLKKELQVTPGGELETLRTQLLSEGTATPTRDRPANGRKPAIAVLPFANLSGDASRQYLSDGLTEDLTTQLARFSEISVVPRSSAFRLSSDSDSYEAARTLGAHFVVKGAARASDQHLIVSCQLLDGANET